MTTVTDLLLNLVPVAVTIILTIILGGLVGNRLSVMWAIRQKRRELQLSAASQFYQLYGEFFAVWKLWSAIKDKAVPTDDSYPHDAGDCSGAPLEPRGTSKLSSSKLRQSED